MSKDSNKEPQDIFKGIDEPETPQKFTNKKLGREGDKELNIEQTSKKSHKLNKKLSKFFSFKMSKTDLTYIGILFLIGLILDGIIIFYSIQKLNFQPNIKVNISHEKISQEVSTPEQEGAQEKIIDSDGDGLSDTRENSLGTYILEPDSDQDGLFDKEEVDIYSTDPLNSDTDEDGKDDGEEVEQGLDPNNPDPKARLLDIKSEINK